MKSLRFLAAPIVALTVTMGAAGCFATPAADPATTVTAAAPASGSPLASKLLTEADVPAGYKSAPMPTLGSEINAVSGCPALSVKPGSAAPPDASVAFSGGAVGSFLTETLRRVTEAEATKALDELAATPQTCAKFDAQTMGIKVEFTATDAKLAPVGERAVAVRLVASAAGLGAIVDEYLVAFKAGDLLVVIAVVGPGQLDRGTVEAVMRKAWQKVSA